MLLQPTDRDPGAETRTWSPVLQLPPRIPPGLRPTVCCQTVLRSSLVHKPAFVTISSRLMSESTVSRLGAATGVASVVVTFIGFGVHGSLPTDITADAVETYVKGVSAGQAGIGNYLELLGYLLFLAFATYLYVVGRANGANSLHWMNVLGLAAATTYIA